MFVVLDEFQHLARADGEIGSIINVWWRERGERLPIFLVLAGSEVGFFEREVVNYSATTYGRRAGQLRLRPFRPRARDPGRSPRGAGPRSGPVLLLPKRVRSAPGGRGRGQPRVRLIEPADLCRPPLA